MALINFARREIEVKIVFYGPALSGKTTNVEVLHRLMPAGQRGELHSLRTEQDRTLFFDYAPMRFGEIAGFTARFKLFTVPGQVYYKETRRVVLQGADAVVFVADSTPARAAANLEALVDLEDNLRAQGLDLSSIPLVVQLNKRDVEGAMSVEGMTAELNPFGVPVIEAVASEGRGVLDTLRRITDIAGQRIRENLSGQSNAMPLTAVERAAPEDERQVVRDHMDAIRAVRPGEDEAVARLRAAGKLDAGQVDAVLSELVVRSEDVTPPEPIDAMDGPFDELPVPRDPMPRPSHGPVLHGPGAAGLAALMGERAPDYAPPAHLVGEATPVNGHAPALPEGAPFDAAIVAPGAVVGDVRSGGVDPDGLARIEIVADWRGERRTHVVTLRMGSASPATNARAGGDLPSTGTTSTDGATAEVVGTPPRGALKWAVFGSAAVFAAVGGMALGVGLGWLAFAG
jgi:signal recognition particle receptor subunit beta